MQRLNIPSLLFNTYIYNEWAGFYDFLVRALGSAITEGYQTRKPGSLYRTCRVFYRLQHRNKTTGANHASHTQSL